MIEVREARADEIAWVEWQTDCRATRNARGVAALDGSQIVGMAAFDMWSGNSCRMLLAFTRKMALRRLLTPMFDYPFVFSGKDVLIAWCPAHSVAALRLVVGLGFKELTRVRDACRVGDPMILLEMRKDDCRWLRRAI